MVPDRQLGELEFGSSASSGIADVYNPNTGGVGAETGAHQELIGWPTSLDNFLSSQESPPHGLRLGCGSSHTPSRCLPFLDLVWAFSTSAGDKVPLAGSQGKLTWVSLDVATLWLTAMLVTPPLRPCLDQSAERELGILPTLKFKHGSSKLCLSFHEAHTERRFEQEWSPTETSPEAVTISCHLRESAASRNRYILPQRNCHARNTDFPQDPRPM